LVFALVNPMSWLVTSMGRMGRALSLTAATTPVVILGIVLGLGHGPTGVAFGYSSAMVLLVLPIVAWSKHGTSITWGDLLKATRQPLLSGLLASAAGLIVKVTLGGMLAPLPYLMVGVSVVLGVYGWVLLIAMGQKHLYVDLLNHAYRNEPA
jgi:PST family polysaccharide transporter